MDHATAEHVSYERSIDKEAAVLRRAETIRGYELRASDGKIGKVADLYFDDQTWTVRHVVAQTGNWLEDKRVLLSPRKVVGLKPDQKVVEASVARAEVEVCEAVDCEKPIAERADILYFPHSFWPAKFEASDMLEARDVHLRSMEEVKGYRVAATDGEIGVVTREYELDLCRFYNREGYWERECED